MTRRTSSSKDEATTEDVVTETIAQVPPAPDQARSAVTTGGKRPRVEGRLAKPVYLIHRGKFEVTIPETTRERLITDEDDPEFGNVITETVTEEYQATGKLPKGSRFGSRKIGVAHELWDKAEVESLRNRGFEDASEADIERAAKMGNQSATTDQIAADERVRAQAKLKKMQGGVRTVRTDEDDE